MEYEPTIFTDDTILPYVTKYLVHDKKTKNMHYKVKQYIKEMKCSLKYSTPIGSTLTVYRGLTCKLSPKSMIKKGSSIFYHHKNFIWTSEDISKVKIFLGDTTQCYKEPNREFTQPSKYLYGSTLLKIIVGDKIEFGVKEPDEIVFLSGYLKILSQRPVNEEPKGKYTEIECEYVSEEEFKHIGIIY